MAAAGRGAGRVEVLCYGDSNTWGMIPGGAGRWPADVRWPGVMRRALGRSFHVVEEGLTGRTTAWDDPLKGAWRNGKTYLTPCLLSHAPLDIVVLFLGVNDLKKRIGRSAEEVARSAGALVDIIRGSRAGRGTGDASEGPAVILVCPPPVGRLNAYTEPFDGAAEASLALSALFAAEARRRGCAFLDAGALIRASDVDGVHFDAKDHRTLGNAAAAVVKALARLRSARVDRDWLR
jgi:lysophospholipase L1-like esterase